MQVSKMIRSVRAVSMPKRMQHTLPDLEYDYGALEPFISAEIMKLHHSKHHQTYVTNLNVFAEKLDTAVAKKDVKSQIELQGALKFNGGGHINHSYPFRLTKASSGPTLLPKQTAAVNSPQITRDFGSLDAFKSKFATQAAGVQGSGWGWLGVNNETKKLEIATTFNQDPLLHLTPILGVDVWEHAYYLQYKNVRPDYLKAIWNVVNWKNVSERYQDAL